MLSILMSYKQLTNTSSMGKYNFFIMGMFDEISDAILIPFLIHCPQRWRDSGMLHTAKVFVEILRRVIFHNILVFCNSCSCIIVFHLAAKDQSLSKLAAEDHFGLLVVLHFSLLPSFHKFRVSKFTIFKFTIFASKLWSSSTSYRPRIPNSSCLSVHPSQKPSSGNISGTKPIDQMGKWANGD